MIDIQIVVNVLVALVIYSGIGNLVKSLLVSNPPQDKNRGRKTFKERLAEKQKEEE